MGGDTQSAANSAQAGKTTVENNAISGAFIGKTDEQVKKNSAIIC
ncbi:VENN motif pre-toxin domain-containing protein [Morganella morganii]